MKKFTHFTFSSFYIFLLISQLLAPTACLPNSSGSDLYHGMDRGYSDHYDTVEHQQDGPIGSHTNNIHASSVKNRNTSHGNCILDERWKGKWFQTGYLQPIYIDSTSIGSKGTCLEKSDKDKFLFFHTDENCYKCLVINERHRNILQYKESIYCEDKDDLDTLCSQIPVDWFTYSLFRIDAQPVDCPFIGAPFTFTYNMGYGDCRDPVSNVDACAENSKLLLRYQACPNIRKTESRTEELECVGEWKEGSNHYLVGKLDNHFTTNSYEELYRCFFYEQINDDSIIDSDGDSRTIGYRIAQSGDASCTDMSSPTDGARTLELNKVEQSNITKCKFPSWVIISHHWQTLDRKISFKIDHKNSTTMYIVDESKGNSTIYSNIIRMYGSHQGRGSSIFNRGIKIVCQTRFDVSDRHVSILAQRIEGCKSESICLDIYKRDNNVIEIKIQPESPHDVRNRECGNNNTIDKSSDTDFYITFVSTTVSETPCPQLGKYMTTVSSPTPDTPVSSDVCSVGEKDSYSTLVFGCGQKGTMQFHSKCTTEESILSYMCHGNWEESGAGYLISTPLSPSSNNSVDRYCFIYKFTEGGLLVSRRSETCQTNLTPEVEEFWAFNVTVNAQCTEPLIGSSTKLQAQGIILMTLLHSVFTVIFLNPIYQASESIFFEFMLIS